MKFHQKNKSQKTIVVISDLHLGAGQLIGNKRNFLEDFFYDEELVEFLEFFSSGEYQEKEVELIINGDFLDLLAVPYVHYFDDEFWSEEAALKKLDLIIQAHSEVFDALEKFLRNKNKKITYIIGNHDAELIFESLQEKICQLFSPSTRACFQILFPRNGEYRPVSDIVIKHGHEYELAHHFSLESNLVVDEEGKKYFLPPWGSYFVTRVINKFKNERIFINQVKPIKKFLIHGLAYDTMFTLRFILSCVFYFVMVRFIYIFIGPFNYRAVLQYLKDELRLFQNYESITEDYLTENEEVKALIVGHSHDPCIRTYAHGAFFINTGTWTKTVNLDFDKRNKDSQLTFAQIDLLHWEEDGQTKQDYAIDLNVWKGSQHLPYQAFS